jgi:hypothetical protein
MAGEINIKPNTTLKIGHGVNDHFRGRLRDLAIESGAASADSISRQYQLEMP